MGKIVRDLCPAAFAKAGSRPPIPACKTMTVKVSTDHSNPAIVARSSGMP